MSDESSMFVNGQPTTFISASDRGLVLGDGFFTTIHLKNGMPLFWDYHQTRLVQHAKKLGFPEPDTSSLKQQLVSLIPDGETGSICGKIIITRGAGGRGYSPSGCLKPTSIVSLHPYPSQYVEWQKAGIDIGICDLRLGIQPMLAGLKTLNRLEQVLLKEELEQKNLAEALVLNATEHVVECVTANLFWRKNKQIFTPILDHSGVCGTMRMAILERLRSEKIQVHQVKADLSDVLSADELWISNALMGVVPVRAVNQQQFKESKSARWLQNEFEKTI